MYEFVRGPLALISFAIFFIGIIARVVWYVKGLDWRLDRVAYTEKMDYGIRGALRSIFHWVLPFNNNRPPSDFYGGNLPFPYMSSRISNFFNGACDASGRIVGYWLDHDS